MLILPILRMKTLGTESTVISVRHIINLKIISGERGGQ